MSRARINKALLFIISEAGGALLPYQLDEWLRDLLKAGYVKAGSRAVSGQGGTYNLPHLVLTEKGKEVQK